MRLENIGKWKIFALETGSFRLDGGAMMGSVAKVLWKETKRIICNASQKKSNTK